MAKPDGRIEKGQRLSTAISARAWNRAQDAADIVLGVRPGVSAGPLSTLGLPCVKAILNDKGYFGEVRVFGDVTPSDNYILPNMPASVSPLGPTTIETLGNATDAEKKLLNYKFPANSRSEAGIGQSQDAILLQRKFAICIGNDSNDYAMSGFAITRIRVTQEKHRRARLPMVIGHSSDSQVAGCLDSAWWGPAEIIGYAEPAVFSGEDDNAQFSFFDSLSGASPTDDIAFDNPRFFWGLVHF